MLSLRPAYLHLIPTQLATTHHILTKKKGVRKLEYWNHFTCKCALILQWTMDSCKHLVWRKLCAAALHHISPDYLPHRSITRHPTT